MHGHHDIVVRLDQRQVQAMLGLVRVTRPLLQLARRSCLSVRQAALGVAERAATLVRHGATVVALAVLTVDDHGPLDGASTHNTLIELIRLCERQFG